MKADLMVHAITTLVADKQDPMVNAMNTLFGSLLSIGVKAGAAVCAFFLMWAGYNWMSAGGNTRQMESAKQALFNALAGLAIILVASVIATMVVNAIPATSVVPPAGG
jgi:hypothetical protein